MKSRRPSLRELANAVALGATLVAALSACTGEKTPATNVAVTTPRVSVIDNPADSASAQPGITLGPKGAMYLSWQVRRADSSIALRFAVRNNGAWSAPHDVATGRNMLWSAGDVPAVHEQPNGRLVAVWRGSHGAKGYDIVMAHSNDQGATWSAPLMPHRDATEMEHGFSSWLQLGDTSALIWVDGRGNDTPDKAQRATRLTLSALDTAGNPTPEVFVDSMICDCCHTSAANVPGGAVVVYRNRAAGEIRDINAIRIAAGVWKAPVGVHADNWHIEGCPVNGPAVSAVGSTVAVAWFTAANDSARVRFALSKDTANSFAAPVDINDGFPDGHVGIALMTSGSAIVSWIERKGAVAVLRVRAVKPDGTRSPALDVAELGPGKRAGGQPKLVVDGDHALLAWTDAATNRVRLARVELP